MMIKVLTYLFLTAALLLPMAAWGAIHTCRDDVIGGARSRTVRTGESLVEIGRNDRVATQPACSERGIASAQKGGK